jgi:hypothetical protein
LETRVEIMRAIVLVLLSMAVAGAAHAQPRTIPAPIYGVTLDNVDNPDAELAALRHIVRMPTVRVVLDRKKGPQHYKKPVQTFRPYAYIVAQIADSAYMKKYTVDQLVARTDRYTKALGNMVDLWEVGNEVNGNWLGSNTLKKIEAMYNGVATKGYAAALTFFYEGEPSEPHNCIVKKHGGNGMFAWIRENFGLDRPPRQRPKATEKIRLGLDYALVSWYPRQCPGERPNWPVVFTKLARIFPNAKVGFGEIGTAKPRGGSRYEVNEIEQFYPMGKRVTGLPDNYVGGYFWWYFAQEMVPWNKTRLSAILNQAIEAGP